MLLNFANDAKRSPYSPPTPTAGDTPSRKGQEASVQEPRGDSHDRADKALASLMPWVFSILFHLGLVCLALFVVWTTMQQPEPEEEIIEPTIHRAADVRVLNPTQPHLPVKTPTPNPTPASILGASPPSPDLSLNNPSELPGVGNPSLGNPNPFTQLPTLGDGSSVGQTIYGPVSNVSRVVYLIDASGSLLDTMPFVTHQLKESIRELADDQFFTVIFFQQNDMIEVPPVGMKKASESAKQRAIDWVDLGSGNVIPQGRANPMGAITKTLRYKPQLVVLLSDNITGHGRYEINQEHLLAEIKKANTAGTKINTIQFIYPDPLIRMGLEPTMKLISLQTGGRYKFIDGRELGIR